MGGQGHLEIKSKKGTLCTCGDLKRKMCLADSDHPWDVNGGGGGKVDGDLPNREGTLYTCRAFQVRNVLGRE